MRVKECKKFKDRLFGIMFKRNKINICYYFPNCNSIHTFFCFQNIDVIMTDKYNNIVHQYKNLKPYRIILPKKNIKNVYEFKEGTSDEVIKSTIDKIKKNS